MFDGGIRACDGGWALSVDGASTTDSDGSIAEADGGGLLMVGKNLKSSTTEHFSLGFWTGMNFQRNFLLCKEVRPEHQHEQHIDQIVKSQQFDQFYPISVGGVQFDFGHIHDHQHKLVAISWYVMSIILQLIYSNS